MVKRKRFSNANEAKRRSREAIGKVPGVRVIPDKRRKKEKHKKKLDNDFGMR